MSSVNNDAYRSLIGSFGAFVENKSVKESMIAKIDRFTLEGVKTLKAGTGDFKGNLLRDALQVAGNNMVRAEFKNAVVSVFGGEDKIPQSVKTAMKWDDFDGKGRPLTARRIRATLAQINAEVRCAEVRCDEIRTVMNAQDWFADAKISPEIKTSLGSYVKQLAAEMNQAMEELLLPDVKKGKAPSVAKMKAFLRRFQNESEAASTILDNIKNAEENIGKDSTCIDPKSRERAIDVSIAKPLARSGAFALALTKNSDLAKFFFSTSKSSNKAVQNFNQAVDELDEEYRGNELADNGEEANTEEGDAFMANIMPLRRMVDPARGYYIMGMSTEDAIAELMRLSADDSQKASLREGKVLIRDAVLALKFSPGPKAKAILTGFFKQVGKQILDDTIRNKNKHGVDPFYEVIDDYMKAMLRDCKANREANEASGTHDLQPELLMESKELDEELLQKILEIRKKS